MHITRGLLREVTAPSPQLSEGVPGVGVGKRDSKGVQVLISRIIKVKDLDVKNLSWGIQGDPVESHKPLNWENIPGHHQRRLMMEAGSSGCYTADLDGGEEALSQGTKWTLGLDKARGQT